MRYIKSLFILLVILTTTTATAQKENAQKILGCWVFKKIEYPSNIDIPKDGSPLPDSVTVCFETEGKYTTTMVGSTEVMTGTYQISEDGKTITQQRDIQEEGTIDEDASIEFPDDNKIILKLEFAQLFFERKS
nr:hypothetical protein [uncultured Flavobacterium sp.]